MLTLDDIEYLNTQLKMHIQFIEYITGDLQGVTYDRQDFDHCYALALVVYPLKQIAERLDIIIGGETVSLFGEPEGGFTD